MAAPIEKVVSKTVKKLVGFNAFGSIYAEVPEEDLPHDFGFEDSICDLSDFTPLAELVRSFQPRDSNAREVEFDYPDGEDADPDNWTAPREYADPADAFEAIRDEKNRLTAKARAVKEKADENLKADAALNSDSTSAKTAEVVEKADESTR